MAIWTLAKKELRLLLRDRRAVVILLAMPCIFILILGMSLGEGFGQKPDDRLRVSLVDLDRGDQPVVLREALAWLARVPATGQMVSAVEAQALGAVVLVANNQLVRPPRESWARVVQRDLDQTAGIRVEIIPTRQEALRLVQTSKRSAVLVFGPLFSERVTRCSFLADGINPFYRDGVKFSEVDAEVLLDETQLAAGSIIEQVAQVTMLRVILPWMIGRAFEKLAEPRFMGMLAEEVPGGKLLPPALKASLGSGVQGALKRLFPKYELTGKTWAALTKSEPRFMGMLAEEVPGGKLLPPALKASLGSGVQGALKRLFPKYELTGKTWAALTKSEPRTGDGAGTTPYMEESGAGLLRRGAVRYQILVPSYTVMFAFFLVLTVGWLFVSERRQGTLKRLRAAPLSRTQILLGKLLPCFALSLTQGLFLLGMGKLVFGMTWGAEPLWLLPVVFTTSLAAMGMAVLVASLAHTETQVAIYGTLLVLVLAGMSGCLMPRELMPEQMKAISRITPHAWALDAYTQLLLNSTPNLAMVGTACLVLALFGVGFVGAAWWFLKLD